MNKGLVSRRKWRAPWIVSATLLFMSLGGCRTQKDAGEAASQMEETARTLAEYYRAIDHVVTGTEDAAEAEAVLNNFAPPDQNQLAVLKETHRQVVLREAMAHDIELLAAVFARLAHSSSAKDASVEAGKLGGELETIKGLGANDAETQALTVGVREIVGLIQQHDEIRAARQMAGLVHQLSVFFDSEREMYDSLNQAYLLLAKSDAQKLVRTGQVDASAVFQSATRPFGLTPEITGQKTREQMQPYLLAQIDRRYEQRLRGGRDATGYLSEGLKEMARRVDLVAHDRVVGLRGAPPTLGEVKSWAAGMID